MFSARKTAWRSATLIAGLAALCALTNASGAEEDFRTRRTLIPDQPVQSVIPKHEEKRPEIKERSINSLSPESSLGGMADLPMMTLRPGMPSRVPLSRQQREELDRRKDWIFVTPDNKAYSVERMLGVREDKKNALKGEEKEFKGVMQSYLERGDKKDKDKDKEDVEKEEGSKTNSSSEASTRTDRPDKYEPLASSTARNSSGGTRLESTGSGRNRSDTDSQKSSLLYDPGSSASLFGPPPDALSGNSLYSDTMRFGGLPTPSARMEKTEAQKAMANEFKQLLDNRPGTGLPANPFGTGNDPVNSFSDATRLPMNPVVGSSLPRSPFEPVNRPSTFDGSGKLGGFGDPSPQIFGTSSLSPALLAPAPPPVSKPAVLELPKRRF